MTQLHVRLTDETKARLKAYADARGISLNAAAAVIIHDKLTESSD